MQDDNNTTPNNDPTVNSQAAPVQPLTRTGGQKVIQPSSALLEELKAQPPQQSLQSTPISPEPIAPTHSTSPSPISSVPSPPAAGQTQVGMSASQMGLNQSQSSKNWKSLLKPLIILAVVLVVLGCGLLLFKSLTGYGSKTVQGDGFSYTVTFSKLSSTTTINGKPYLQGKDKSGQAMLLYVGKSTKSQYDCYGGSGSTISIISTPTIDGSKHNLCYSKSLNLYDMNFTHNNVWYFITVAPKDNSATLDQDTVKMIANSVSIQ